MADGRVELFDVKPNKTVVLFVFNGFKPLDHGYCVFPLIEFGCSRDFAVDSVEDCFADSAYLGFVGVNKSAGRFVSEVRFVVFQCYESVFVSCHVHSVIDGSFRCDVFVF